MDKETFDLSKELDEDLKPIRCGDEVIYPPLVVGGKSYRFDAPRIRFIYAMQKTKGDLEDSCRMSGVTRSFADKFIASRKWRSYRNTKIAIVKARHGDLIDEWWQTGIEGMRGFKAWYEGHCLICSVLNVFTENEAEAFRQDDMTFSATCSNCMQSLAIELKREDVRPSREQVQFWDGIGNRLVPKIERVQHEFSSETFKFVEGDAA
jgi:hypothetical protein